MNNLKNLLNEIENLILDKKKLEKRLQTLDNEKKEVLQLKKQTLERYKTQLSNLISTKLKLENNIKFDDSSLLIMNNFGNNISQFASKLKSKDKNTTYESNEDKYSPNKTNNRELSLNFLNTCPNLHENIIKLNINTNTNNNISSINIQEKTLPNINSSNNKQKIQQLTAINFKISAVNERIDRMNNVHETTLIEIKYSEELIMNQMKNIENSINSLKTNIFSPELQKNNNEEGNSEEYTKKIFDNSRENNKVNNKLDKNINYNNEKIEEIFEEINNLKKDILEKNKKLTLAEQENKNKEKIILDFQNKINFNNNINKNKLSDKVEKNKIYDVIEKKNLEELKLKIKKINFNTKTMESKKNNFSSEMGNKVNLNIENREFFF